MVSRVLDVPNAGEAGIVADMAYSEIAPNAWTSGYNVRMDRNEVQSFPGHVSVSNNPDLQYITSLRGVTNNTSHYWVQAGLGTSGFMQYFAFDGSAFTEITPAGGPLLAQPSDLIIGDILNQNLVVTDGVDPPYYWPLDLGQQMQILPGWDTEGNETCRALKAFKGFLIALDMTQSGVRYPYRVKWSDQTAPGGLPQSWDPLDPTVLAGEQDLGDTNSFLLNGLGLRDTFVIYSEKETIGMQLVGGDQTWRFFTISTESGLLARRAVSTLRGMQIAVTDGDVIRTDGQTVQTIIDRQNRRWMFDQLDQDNYGLTFTVVNSRFNEVWVCFPSQGFNYCNQALVWNWRTGVWGQRDLPPLCLSAANVLDIVGRETVTWETNPDAWFESDQVWGERDYDSTLDVVILSGQGNLSSSRIFRAETGNLYDSNPRLSRVEKLGMRLSGERNVTVHEVWPRALGATFTVQIGSQKEPNGPVSWKSTQRFDPETDTKITCRVSGRYICVAFQSEDDADWSLQGFSLKYRDRGAR